MAVTMARWRQDALANVRPQSRCGKGLSRPATPEKPDRALLTTEQVRAAINRAALVGPYCELAVHLVSACGQRSASLVVLRIGDMEAKCIRLKVEGGAIIDHPVLPKTHELWQAAAGDGSDSERPLLHTKDEPWRDCRSLDSWYHNDMGKHAHPHDKGIYALNRYAITTTLDHFDAKTVASITGANDSDLLQKRHSRTNEKRQQAALKRLANL